MNAKNGKFVAPKDGIINCGLGGTTTRFMLGLSALFDFDITITAEGKMLERPIDELFDFLKNTGKEIVFLKNDTKVKFLDEYKSFVKEGELSGCKKAKEFIRESFTDNITKLAMMKKYYKCYGK